MSDIGNTSLDSRGSYAQPRYINDLNSTTRFHPSELPADPEAIRSFPKHLIDPAHYTESPGSDSSLDTRLERARESFIEHAHKWGGVEKMREFLSGLGTGNPTPQQSVAEPESDAPSEGAEQVTPDGEPPSDGTDSTGEDAGAPQ